MEISLHAPNVPPSLYGATGFQIVMNLLALLRDKGILSQDDRAGLLNTVAGGMQPSSDPHVKAMKDFLVKLSGLTSSR